MPIIDNDLFTFRKLLMIFGLFFFVLGIVMVSAEWRNTGSLILLATIFIFLGLYTLNGKYKEYKKIYLEYLPNDKVNDILNHGSFEFTHDHLNFKIKKVINKINWTDILNYKLINSKHVVLFNKESEKNLIISETEMDKSDFKKVVEFIEERVEKTTYNTV